MLLFGVRKTHFRSQRSIPHVLARAVAISVAVMGGLREFYGARGKCGAIGARKVSGAIDVI